MHTPSVATPPVVLQTNVHYSLLRVFRAELAVFGAGLSACRVLDTPSLPTLLADHIHHPALRVCRAEIHLLRAGLAVRLVHHLPPHLLLPSPTIILSLACARQNSLFLVPATANEHLEIYILFVHICCSRRHRHSNLIVLKAALRPVPASLYHSIFQHRW